MEKSVSREILSDVNIPEVIIGGSQHLQHITFTVHNYNIKKSGTITGKAAIFEPQIQTNIWVATVDATPQKTNVGHNFCM